MAQVIMMGRRLARDALFGVLVGLAGLLSGASAAQAQSSEWSTEFGPLILVLKSDGMTVTGRFPDYSGKFIGQLDPTTGVLEGTWRQPTSEVRCDTPMDGSHHWGLVTWELGRGSDLRGAWGYCWQNPSEGGQWNGSLVRGTNPYDIAQARLAPPPPTNPNPPSVAGAGDGGAGVGAPSKADLLSRYGGAAAQANGGVSEGGSAGAAATGDEAMATARFLWGQNVDPGRLTVLRKDVTCDGKPDLTLGYHNVDIPDGPFFEVAVRETGADLESIPVAFLDFDQGGFQSLCGGGGPISVTVEGNLMPADVEALTGLTAPPLCRVGLRVDDGMCDAVWVFTTPGRDRLTDLVFGRN